jgi:hypothetical protein
LGAAIRLCRDTFRRLGLLGYQGKEHEGGQDGQDKDDRSRRRAGHLPHMPGFRLRGKTVAGFAAFKHHLSYLPHSGSVIPQLGEELEGYPSTSGSLHFPVDQPLPEALVRKLLAVRMAEAFGGR